MIDLLEMNKQMLRDGKYNVADTRLLSKITGLQNPNDYDKYQIVCALCNYDLPELAELRDLRMHYFQIVSSSGIDYSHKDSDYAKVQSGIRCVNTGEINKYGHLTFEINASAPSLVNELWRYHSKDCLKYVDSKSVPGKVVVSVSKDQFESFRAMLDKMNVDYDKKNLEKNVIFSNRSTHKLVDVDSLDLPFKPFDYQIEDAERILKTKRYLIGHEMGCVAGKSIVSVTVNGIHRAINVQTLCNIFDGINSIEIRTRLNGENVFCKILSVINNGIQDTIRISTATSAIECTPDHRIYTAEGWKAAMDIKEGDLLVTNEHTGVTTSVSNLSPSLFIDVTTDEYCQATLSQGKATLFCEPVTSISQGNRQLVYDIVIDSPFCHNFLCNNFVVHNCGKTLISVLVGESINMPKLVICPPSLRINWYREIKQARHSADVKILYSNCDIDKFEFGEDWTIVGSKTVTKFLPQLMKKFKCMFVDEAHNYKSVTNYGNPASKRAQSILALSRNVTYCYLITGTPVPSKNKDLFNILKMLKCEAYNLDSIWSFKNFADTFCDPKDNGFGMNYDGNSNSEELHNVLNKLMVRRLKKDVLPDLKKQRQFIPLDPKFKQDYKSIESRLYYPIRGKDGKFDSFLGLAMTGRRILSQYKVDAAIEMAETILNSEDSVVIVTNFDDTAEKLKMKFKKDACEIRGGQTDKVRQLALDDFQSRKKHVCILNMQAGGVGITLTAAHTMIVIDYLWNPTDMIQVEDRICRTGQTEMCVIYYLYCYSSTLDNIFVDMLSSKAANTDMVVDAAENSYDLTSAKENAENSFIQNIKEAVEHDTYGIKSKIKPKKGR